MATAVNRDICIRLARAGGLTFGSLHGPVERFGMRLAVERLPGVLPILLDVGHGLHGLAFLLPTRIHVLLTTLMPRCPSCVRWVVAFGRDVGGSGSVGCGDDGGACTGTFFASSFLVKPIAWVWACWAEKPLVDAMIGHFELRAEHAVGIESIQISESDDPKTVI